MVLGGVDGCHKGWILVKYMNDNYTYGVYENFQDLIDEHPEMDSILIDMPIGLSSRSHKRTIDHLLRKALKGRASTVFNAPCRDSIYITDVEKAKQKNREIEGKNLSIQSLSLCEKIKQLDVYLQKTTSKQIPVIESHPELCFKYLNKGHQVLLSRKSTKEGLAERLGILKQYESRIEVLFEKIVKETKRKDVKKDDIIDALCLCIVNKWGTQEKMHFLQDVNCNQDEKQIALRIGFYKS